MAKRYSGRSRRRYSRSFKIFKRRQFRKRVWKAINSRAEKKTHLTAAGDQSVQNTWQVSRPLSTIAQGVARGARIGNKIFCRYLNVRFWIRQNDSNTVPFRWVVVIPRASAVYTNADLPQFADSHIDVDKFHIVWDSAFYLGDTNTNPGVTTERVIKRSFKIMRTVLYDDTVTTPTKNDVWVGWWSSDALLTAPLINFSIMTTYTDI